MLSNHLQNICFVVVVFVCLFVVIFLLGTFERQQNAGLSSAMGDIIALTRKCTWGANKSQIPSATFWYERQFYNAYGVVSLSEGNRTDWLSVGLEMKGRTRQ